MKKYIQALTLGILCIQAAAPLKAIAPEVIERVPTKHQRQVFADAEHYKRWGTWKLQLNSLIGRSQKTLAHITKVRADLADIHASCIAELEVLDRELAKAKKAVRQPEFIECVITVALLPWLLLAGNSARTIIEPSGSQHVRNIEQDRKIIRKEQERAASLLATLDTLLASYSHTTGAA